MRTLNRVSCLVGCLVLGAAAHSANQPAADGVLALEPSAVDSAAARQTTHRSAHMLPVASHQEHRDNTRELTGSKAANANSRAGNHAVRYIGTLTYQGGPVMQSAVEHNIYMFPSNGACPDVAACWGDPKRFLADLGQSEFIHVTDQYVGTTANGRYTVGVSGHVNYTIPSKPLVDLDIQTIVHNMVVKDGQLNGYGHEYHVFLPPGQDECFDTTYSVCYSPDNPATFVFCAYHGSVDFPDVGHVIYSVEPWLDTPDCQALLPDGAHFTGQNSILSHETIESITDPDGDAWWNASGNLDLFGYEIGDECQWITFDSQGVPWFLFDNVYLNGRQYWIQSEYNNHANGCTDGPGPCDD